MPDLIEIEFFPYGKATTSQQDDGKIFIDLSSYNFFSVLPTI